MDSGESGYNSGDLRRLLEEAPGHPHNEWARFNCGVRMIERAAAISTSLTVQLRIEQVLGDLYMVIEDHDIASCTQEWQDAMDALVGSNFSSDALTQEFHRSLQQAAQQIQEERRLEAQQAIVAQLGHGHRALRTAQAHS